jgi:acetylornithine deacetylase
VSGRPGGPDIRVDAGAAEDLLRRLVAIPSVNPRLVPGGAGESAIARCLAGECARLGLEVTVEEAAPGRPNVVAVLRGTDRAGARSLLLNGHTDTVGVEGMPEPFTPMTRGGRLYGRGAFDMKAGLAAMVAAAGALVRSGRRLRGDLLLAFVADEEDASLGTAALVRRWRADAAIVTEPTGLRVCLAHKGFVWATVRTEGRAAHGSDSAAGIDAIVHMGRVLREIERLDRDVLAGRGHPLLGRPTIHASVISGGDGPSTYPRSCRLVLERRTLPAETEAQVRRELDALLDRLRAADPAFRADLQVTLARPGLEVDAGAEVVRVLDRAVLARTGRAAAHVGMSAWFDAALLAAAGIPTVIFGPAGAGWHGDEEYADIASVAECAGIIAAAAVEFCGAPA